MVNINENIIKTVSYYKSLFNSFNDNQKQQYLLLLSYYYYYLINYLNNKLDLKKYDEIVLNSKNKYSSVNESEMDFYQYICKNHFDYIYIRNNIYIERLTTEEKNEFLNIINTYNTQYDSKIDNYIEKTIKKILINIPTNPENKRVNYGPTSIDYISKNLSIVIGIRYNKYDNYFEDYNDNRLKEIELLKDLMKIELEKKCLKILDIGFDIIEYNDFTVKRIMK